MFHIFKKFDPHQNGITSSGGRQQIQQPEPGCPPNRLRNNACSLAFISGSRLAPLGGSGCAVSMVMCAMGVSAATDCMACRGGLSWLEMLPFIWMEHNDYRMRWSIIDSQRYTRNVRLVYRSGLIVPSRLELKHAEYPMIIFQRSTTFSSQICKYSCISVEISTLKKNSTWFSNCSQIWLDFFLFS